MHLLVLILNKTSYLEEILHTFNLIGIKGATVIDSIGVGRTIADHSRSNFAVMYSLHKIIDGGRPYNKTIISVIDEDLIEPAIDGIHDILGDMSQPGVGILFTFPLDRVVGLPKTYY